VPTRIRLHVWRLSITFMPRLAWCGPTRVMTGHRRGAQGWRDSGDVSMRGVGVLMWFRCRRSTSPRFDLTVVRP
jgi:hypothetical protein